MPNTHLIGNAHIDPVWLWRKREGMSEVLATFRSALDRMNEFPDYVFTCACAYYYDYVAKVDPDMMAEIRARVREGRWVVVGGTWVQTDMNIPSAEAFARQELYSQRTFRALTGRMATTGYCVDSFGHNGMTPQLLKLGRMKNYVFQRPSNVENPTLPDLFAWRSPDGSTVSVYRLPYSYTTDNIPDPEGKYEGCSPAVKKACVQSEAVQKTKLPAMCFYGVGNHGGGPTIDELNALTKLTRERGDIRFSDPDTFFAEAASEKLPVWSHDLQHHASGCYSANSTLKSLNCRAERALFEAELYDVLAGTLAGAESSQARITEAWKKVLFNQFHDILAGCTIRSAADEACRAFSSAIDEAEDITMLALSRISRRVNTRPDWAAAGAVRKHGWALWQGDDGRMLGDLRPGIGAPLIVFNPHSHAVRACVPAGVTVGSLRDASGEVLPVQQIRGEQTNGTDTLTTLLPVCVPPLGYSVYYLYAEAEKPTVLPDNTVSVLEEGNTIVLENGLLRACFSRTSGLISTLTDLSTGRILARNAGLPVLTDDSDCDTWSHGVFAFNKEDGAFRPVSVRITDNGILCATVRVEYELRGNRMVQYFSLDAGDSVLRVKVQLFMEDRLRMCRILFPAEADKPRCLTSMPGGFIEKAADTREQPCHRWAGVFGSDFKGLAVLNDGRYSVSFDGGTVRLVAARTAIYADHYGQKTRDDQVNYLDLGLTEFTYGLTMLDVDAVDECVRRAELLASPLLTRMEAQHDGKLPPVWQGISVEDPGIRLQALKRSENGRGYIVRLSETGGRTSGGEVRLDALNITLDTYLPPLGIATYYKDDMATDPRVTDFIEPD